jgi:para-aminobenzoate synthetase component I
VRTTLVIDGAVGAVPALLLHEEHFLYRRVGDQDRAVLAIGVHAEVEEPAFDDSGRAADWYFGALPYEWVGPDGSSSVALDGSPVARWWIPKWVVEWRHEAVFLHVHPTHAAGGEALREALRIELPDPGSDMEADWTERCDRADYLARVERLMHHIQRGDIYEVNYCIERTAHWPTLDPFAAFLRLLRRSQAPFAAFMRSGDRFLLSASPERFLAFDHRQVIGEPMKGTRPRSADPEEDVRLRDELAQDAKERSENIMAVDVMRHDLSRIAAPASVMVKELCGVRSYPRVHQLVSTITATIAPAYGPMDVIRAAFPMASMTGAPKEYAMRLIAAAEGGPRGAFSGSLGFFAPDGTGDLNVVIRSIVFDRRSGLASLRTGSALTALCDPAAEWEECAVKARSVLDALRHA